METSCLNGLTVFLQTNFPYYNGQNFVRDHDDLIVVTINYRLNIFGQPSAPQLNSRTQSQNFGLLDQKAAIEWVHDNIENFGGDPNRIVLFGESAGSISTDAYTYANPADTIVKGKLSNSKFVCSHLFQELFKNRAGGDKTCRGALN